MDKVAEKRILAARDEVKIRTLLRYEDKFEKELVEPRARLAEALLNNPHHELTGVDVPNFFESLSTMLQLDYVDAETLWNFFERHARLYWWALQEQLRDDRRRCHDDVLWTGFDILVEKLAEISRKQTGREPAEPTRTEINEFLRDEARSRTIQKKSNGLLTRARR